MPNTTAVPSASRAPAPAPSAIASGTVPRMNANEVIRIGRSLSLAPSRRGLLDRFALLALELGEFDDEDGVLGRQTNQHDQPDLGVDVVVEADAGSRPRNAPNTPNGITSRMATGIAQLS